MPFVLKTITMEERIAATVPNSRYEAFLESILADEASGWKYKVLAGEDTMFDAEVTKARIALKDAEADKVASAALVEKLYKNLQAKEAEKRSTNKIQFAKDLTAISGMKSQLAASQDESAGSGEIIHLLKQQVRKMEGLQDIARRQTRSLRNVVSQYKENKDRDFLRRGVHCVCSIGTEMSAKV
jgi:hypothetical protein